MSQESQNSDQKATPTTSPLTSDFPAKPQPQVAPGTKDPLTSLIDTVYRLRAPGGCPWDREQTHHSLRPYLIEEAYEVLEVLDQIKTDDLLKQNTELKSELREELGDLLLQVLLHSQLTHEQALFNIFDVANELNNKLIRRHPHVFTSDQVGSSEEVLQNWEKQKAKEKEGKQNSSVLDGVPSQLPALLKSFRTIEKVSKLGFQWNELSGAYEKFKEEISELEDEIRATRPEKERIEDELGDVLFSLCNVAYHLRVDPENALRRTLGKFTSRFQHIEKRMKEEQLQFGETSLEKMDEFWNEAKNQEKKQEKKREKPHD